MLSPTLVKANLCSGNSGLKYTFTSRSTWNLISTFSSSVSKPLIVLLLNSSKTFKLEPSLTFNISSFFKTGFCFFTSSLGFSTFPLLQAKTKLSKNINVTNFFILFSLLLSFNFKTPFKSVIFCLIIRLNLHFHIFNFTHSQRLY